MTKLDVRPYAGATDLPLVAALMRAASPLTPHLLDYPWRLGSHAIETGRDIAVCRALDGSVTGLAAWQAPWAALDLFLRPGVAHDETATALLAWAETRFRELDSARGRALPYWVEARESDAARLALLACHGYTSDTDYGYSTLRRTLVAPLAMANRRLDSNFARWTGPPTSRLTSSSTGAPSRAPR